MSRILQFRHWPSGLSTAASRERFPVVGSYRQTVPYCDCHAVLSGKD